MRAVERGSREKVVVLDDTSFEIYGESMGAISESWVSGVTIGKLTGGGEAEILISHIISHAIPCFTA
jgi:hypothetical protein